MFVSRFLPCEQCGESVERAVSASHSCDPERRLDFLMFGLRDEIDSFERRFRDYVSTPAGRFDAWLAARELRLRT